MISAPTEWDGRSYKPAPHWEVPAQLPGPWAGGTGRVQDRSGRREFD